MTFQGNIKGGENARSSSPRIFFEQDRPILLFSLTSAADSITMRRAHPIYGPFFLGNHSIIIYSSLLDQRIPEASNWMFYSCFDLSTNKILALSSATEFFLWLQQLNSCSDFSNSILALTSATKSLLNNLGDYSFTSNSFLLNQKDVELLTEC